MGYIGYVRSLNNIQYGSGMGGSMYDDIIHFIYQASEMFELNISIPDYGEQTWNLKKPSLNNL